MSIKRVLCAAAAVAGVVAFASTPSSAQEYPTKPVKLLIGFAPGGPTDLVGRVLADYLAKTTGQPFVVESKPGASGIIAGQALANAPPDGYTLNVISFAIVATARAMYDSMTFDPATAFAPVTPLVRNPLILEVASTLPVKTYKEFIDYAKKNSGKLNHGSPGSGTQPHLVSALFMERNGFTSTHIPYRGNGPLLQGMMQKEMDWVFDVPSNSLPLLKAGNVRLLAVTTDQRWPEFPDVPTMSELGVADSVWPSWFGLVAPAGTPKPIVDKLATMIAKGWKEPEYIARLKTIGYEPWTMTPEETTKFFALERERWTKVVKDNNIKAE